MLRLEFFFLVDTVQYQQRHCGFFCSLCHPGCSVWFWGAMGGKEKSMLLPPCLIQNPHSYVTSAHCHRGKGDYLEANGGLTSERYETFGGAPLRSKWTNLILNGVARDMLIFFVWIIITGSSFGTSSWWTELRLQPGAEEAPLPFFFSSDNSQFCSITPEETHFTNMKMNRKVYFHIQI